MGETIMSDNHVPPGGAGSSALTFEDRTCSVKRDRSIDDPVMAGDAFLHMPGLKILEVDETLLSSSLELIKRHWMEPRDSIHATSPQSLHSSSTSLRDLLIQRVVPLSILPLATSR